MVDPDLENDHDHVEVDLAARFQTFYDEVEPRLRRALVAAYGSSLGSDACADAMAYAWENFDRLLPMDNPAGYLWRVGQSAARRQFRRNGEWSLDGHDVAATDSADRFEPALVHAIARLSTRQRTAVLLVHGHGMSLSAAAELMDCRIRTVRNHLDRGLQKLRTHLGATDHG